MLPCELFPIFLPSSRMPGPSCRDSSVREWRKRSKIWQIAPEDSSKWIAKPDTWDAVITREDTIRLRGLLEEKGTDFVLIQINEKDYPLWILGSSFDTDIPLERGENTVTAEVKAGDYKTAQLKVIRVDNITGMAVSEMVLKDDGSEQSLYAEDPVEIAAESKFRTRIPRIQISGQHNFQDVSSRLFLQDG